MSTLQEEDRTVNSDSPLYEEFALDELPTDLIIENTPSDDCSPFIFVSADCCSSSSPSSITIDSCDISDNKDIQTELDCQGRLLTIRVLLKCVCPNKKIAVGVLLFGKDGVVKGFKVKEIVAPPHPTSEPGQNCEHVAVCKFCFVLPSSICFPLTLTAKVIAHYTDFDIDP